MKNLIVFLIVLITFSKAWAYDAKTCTSFQIKVDLVENLTKKQSNLPREWRDPGLYVSTLFTTKASIQLSTDRKEATLTFRDAATESAQFSVTWGIEYDDGFRTVLAKDLEKIVLNGIYNLRQNSSDRKIVLDWLNDELSTDDGDGEVKLRFEPGDSFEDMIIGSEDYKISKNKKLIIGFQFAGCEISND